MRDVKWLSDHIIDLTKSTWDKEKSDPAKGVFVFKTKVYQKLGSDSPWKFGFFIRYYPPYREIPMMEAAYSITPVKASECLACVDGLTPNAEGYYQFDDVILAKEPRMKFYERRDESVKDIDRQLSGARNNFKEEGDKVGVKVENWDA